MHRTLLVALFLSAVSVSTPVLHAQEAIRVQGLTEPVEIIKDRWGISHVYAETEDDLFFAQGFNAARDRLFQLEMWRRQATGTVAEILGRRELERDIGTRLFQFRGYMTQELRHYHERGDRIIAAFVRGVNAYIALTERRPELLPLEFELLGITPGRWVPAVVISRHQGLLGNIEQELNLGRAVAAAGSETVNALSHFHPGEPDLSLDGALNGEVLAADILDLYTSFRRSIRFRPEDVIAAHRNDRESFDRLSRALDVATAVEDGVRESIGSNNWVVRGDLTQSGFTMMANDPHRAQAAPSLRYWVHLVGPGWNVIGGGEPEIPGVSIGHNEYGAWGLTVFGTDGEDLMVYDTNPVDPLQYRYRGSWERMTVVTDTIAVRGEPSVVVDLKYTRHGPVVFEDLDLRRAYAVRAAWMEVGGAPYLASLRMDQARTWEEFRDACAYSHIPGENMVWADRSGTIGWQAVGIAPIRRNWSGLVPVPGDGRYEWDGYLPIKAKPHVVNPSTDFFATANNNLIPPDYPYRDAVGWSWADPYRWARITEVLADGRKHTMMDMMNLQTDYLSIPARTLTPLLHGVSVTAPDVERARRLLLEWDFRLEPSSAAAGIYVAWERAIQRAMAERFIPAAARDYIRSIPMKLIIDWLVAPSGAFGASPIDGRDRMLGDALHEAVNALRERFGGDMSEWRYGDPKYKHALIRHPLSAAVNAEVRARLDVGPLPRGGNSYTPNSTGAGDNQTSGASFRIVVDTEDWDKTVGTNTPGQSGDPANPHYADLFELWATDRYFPVFFSRARVEGVAGETVRLVPD